jgi:hypothetical protein
MIFRVLVMTIGAASLMTCLVAQVRKDDGKSIEDRLHIIGTWELVGTEERLTDGSKRPYRDVGASGKGLPHVYGGWTHGCCWVES